MWPSKHIRNVILAVDIIRANAYVALDRSG